MAGGLGAFRQHQLTLNGSVQQLSTAVQTDATIVVTASREWDPVASYIDLQADDGNSNPVYIGYDNTVSAGNHGVRIPTPSAGVPSPPYRIEGPIQLRDIWVIGTNNEKLNIAVTIK